MKNLLNILAIYQIKTNVHCLQLLKDEDLSLFLNEKLGVLDRWLNKMAHLDAYFWTLKSISHYFLALHRPID